MSGSQNNSGKGGWAFRITFFVGLAIWIAALFIPARKGDILENQEIGSLWNAFMGKNADGVHWSQMLFGHGPENLIGMPPALLDILILFLPFALMLAAVVMILCFPRNKLGLVLGIIGAVMIIGVDIFLLITHSACFGIYLSLAGMVIALLGLLLFYIDSDEEEVAGVIICSTGCYAGSTFEVTDQVVIGKNPAECNIVLQNKTISRVHCIIRYLPETDSYMVKDVSSNGTFISDGRRFVKNMDTPVARGTEIHMGDPRETFYLD